MASLPGIERVAAHPEYLELRGITPEQFARSTHIAWITGGSMVPPEEMDAYVSRGKRLLASMS